jgi:hypothetical protein
MIDKPWECRTLDQIHDRLATSLFFLTALTLVAKQRSG